MHHFLAGISSALNELILKGKALEFNMQKKIRMPNQSVGEMEEKWGFSETSGNDLN